MRSALAATVFVAAAASALAQGAIPGLQERAAAAAAMRAKVAAGEVRVATQDFADWWGDCSQAPLDPAPVCRVFSRMLVEDENRQLGVVAVTVFTRPALTVRVASDWQFPALARLQIDTLPPLDVRACTTNSCTYTGEAAQQVVDELLTGATVLARYEARAAMFKGRLSLDAFAAKYAEIAQR